MIKLFLFLFGFTFMPAANAEMPQDFLARYIAEAKQQNPLFNGFDPSRGEQFFMDRHGSEWSCASCHTDDPKGPGKHAETQKPIKPMAPAVNPERFTDALKVEKWYKRSCKDILARECSAQEKGDVLAYLLTKK